MICKHKSTKLNSSNDLDSNYTRMLQAILNKSWRQHPTRHQLYGHLPPSMKTIQTCRTLLEKQGRAHKWCTPMDPHIWPGKIRTTSSNIHTAAMWGYGMSPWRPNEREKWRERVRDIRASGTTWWWWWWWLLFITNDSIKDHSFVYTVKSSNNCILKNSAKRR